MVLFFRLGGSGGGTTYQPYDSSTKQAEMSVARTKMRDETTSRAYGAALNADVYKNLNVTALNEGLGFLTKYLDEQVKGAQEQTSIAQKGNNELIPTLQSKASGAASAVNNSLMDYINQSTTKAQDLYNQYSGGGQ